MSYIKSNAVNTKKNVRHGRTGAIPVWIPYGGIIRSADNTVLEHIHSFRSLMDIPEIEVTSLEEFTVTSLNREDLVVYAGTKIEPFEITMHGNAVEALASYMGLDLSANPVVAVDPEIEQLGTLAVITFEPGTATVNSTDVFTNMRARVVKTPTAVSGQQSATISLRSDNPKVIRIPRGYSFALDTWYADANITNAASTGTALTLGTGNGSGSVTPSAEVIFPDATGAAQYYLTVQYGDRATPEEIVQDCTSTATVLTIPNAMASGKICQAIYVTAVASVTCKALVTECWEDVNVT